MTLYGDGRAALVDDGATAERLGWRARRRSRPEPEVLLRPREGDPRTEPWVLPGWADPKGGLEGLRRRSRRRMWTYLTRPPGVVRHLEALARPASERRGLRVALAGLGRVGGVAATMLAVIPSRLSGVRELLLHDVDDANRERWLMELGSIARWGSREELPLVRAVSRGEIFERCDAFLFAASDSVPPVEMRGDVRGVQFAPNRTIMRPLLAEAKAVGYTGLFLIVSDPVDPLALAAFRDSNHDESGAFVGDGLAPERCAGLGLGVMWGRTLHHARREGSGRTVERFGGLYGPHGDGVVAFDDVRKPDTALSRALTRAAREGNLRIRDLGFLPYVGPGVSSVALSLPPLLAGQEVLANAFIDGIYFGGPCRLDWGLYPNAKPLSAGAWESVVEAHAQLRRLVASYGLL